MQSRWDEKSVFVHDSKSDDYSVNIKLSLLALLKLLRRALEIDVIVFHAQSSLPYLLISYLYIKLVGKKILFIYDIHDLHEWDLSFKLISRPALRYCVLGFFEWIVFSIEEIRKITVSNGLAILMSKKYGKPPPVVVRNTSSEGKRLPFANRLKNTVLFFGIKERAPIGLFDKLNSVGVEVHLYGRGMTEDWLVNILRDNLGGVKVFGEYSPERMDFLNNYKVLILYPSDNKLNYKYSMPNKLFQAIDHGLCVVVSDYFDEILQTFKSAAGCIYSANDENIQSAVLEALECWTDDSCAQARVIQSEINADSRNKYIESLRWAP